MTASRASTPTTRPRWSGTSATRFARSERIGLRAVLDTNVGVSGLIVRCSPPGRVIDAALGGRFDVVASWELAEEMVDVLRRPKLRRYEIEEADIADVLAVLAPLLPGVEVTVGLRDPADAPVLATAAATSAEAIVTGDRDLLDEPHAREWCNGRGIELLRPVDFLERLGL